MRFPHVEIGLVAVAFAASAVVAAVLGSPAVDAFFGGVVLSFVLLLLRLVQRSVSALVRTRRQERQVTAQTPEAVARRAVEAERARLSAEIDESVRRSLGAVATLARSAVDAPDPRPALRQIQAEARGAMEELRRQLGLLAGPPEPDRVRSPDLGRERGRDRAVLRRAPGEVRRRRPARSDLITTLAVLVLAAVDQRLPGTELDLGSWAMSSLLALTLLTRRAAPVPSAWAGSAVLLLGVALATPVADGFSYPVMWGLLLWSVLTQRPSPPAAATAAVLIVSAVGSRWAHEPENGPINVVLVVLVTLGALTYGAVSRARESSGRRAAAHEHRLETARRQAVEDDRRALARELHDVASHAVSLTAVHAGAAELAWDRDPAAARHGLRTITETVDAALADLGRRRWAEPAASAWVDVERTVERLRAAGLGVDVVQQGEPPQQLLSTVHRLVQESLTNALKHAPGSRVTLRVVTGEHGTEVEVTDDGRAALSGGRGYGLVGLADRVRGAGGTFTAGPVSLLDPDGRAATGGRHGFRVHAVLPHPGHRPVTPVGRTPAGPRPQPNPAAAQGSLG